VNIDRWLTVLSLVLAIAAWVFPQLPSSIRQFVKELTRGASKANIKRAMKNSRRSLATRKLIFRSFPFAVAFFFRRVIFLFTFSLLALTAQSPVMVAGMKSEEMQTYGWIVTALVLFIGLFAIATAAVLGESTDRKLRDRAIWNHKQLAKKYRKFENG
jgi:uncharacterized membrane protein